MRDKLKCNKCDYEWYPRNPEVRVKECPECKSRNYDTDRLKSKTKKKDGFTY
ncbi:MAG: hypothetical protein AABY22_03050 [Nanoarchaeota archaeon]